MYATFNLLQQGYRQQFHVRVKKGNVDTRRTKNIRLINAYPCPVSVISTSLISSLLDETETWKDVCAVRGLIEAPPMIFLPRHKIAYAHLERKMFTDEPVHRISISIEGFNIETRRIMCNLHCFQMG